MAFVVPLSTVRDRPRVLTTNRPPYLSRDCRGGVRRGGSGRRLDLVFTIGFVGGRSFTAQGNKHPDVTAMDLGVTSVNSRHIIR